MIIIRWLILPLHPLGGLPFPLLASGRDRLFYIAVVLDDWLLERQEQHRSDAPQLQVGGAPLVAIFSLHASALNLYQWDRAGANRCQSVSSFSVRRLMPY